MLFSIYHITKGVKIMPIWNERIHEKRLEKGITLAQIADRLGVTEATAQRYERGNIKNIPYEHMCAYGEILNCSPAYLMGWVNDKKEDGLIDYFDDTLEDTILFLEKNGYTVLRTDSSSDDSIIVKNKSGQIIKTITCGELVGQYEKMKIENLPKTIENLLDIESTDILPERIRSAARGMMDLSDSDQELAINMIHSLAMKGRRANKD